jgi:hypothetical protein
MFQTAILAGRQPFVDRRGRRRAWILLPGVLAAAIAMMLAPPAAEASSPQPTWTSVSVSSEGVLGERHTCAIDSTASLWCWGGNGWGQLGLGDTTPRHTPVQVQPGSQWRTVSANIAATCAIKTDSTLWCWGSNQVGTLGLGQGVDQTSTPTRVGTRSDWDKLAATPERGGECATTTDLQLWCWGWNVNGELGLDTDIHWVPTQIPGSWVAVAGGDDHSCGLQADFSLWCWGSNDHGALGGPGVGQELQPVRVGTATNWVSVQAGAYFTCARRSDRTLWCWGDNSAGQLGQGDEQHRSVPTRVGVRKWLRMGIGRASSCAVPAAGGLRCWGLNTDGQLGLGDRRAVRLRPQTVSTKTGWHFVTMGDNSACGIQGAGKLYCWGRNDSGQLGQGDDLSSRLTPTRVLVP